MSMVRLPYSIIFTARKRSLRRLCFYTCLSVILFMGEGGGCVSQYSMVRQPCRKTPPGRQTLQEDRPLPGRQTPQGRHHEDPQGALHAGRYGQQAGGTHPTGMDTWLESR